MFEKLRRLLNPNSRVRKPFGWKNWLAYILFGAIIVVFALFGLDQNQGMQSTGGVAAVVNDSAISLAEYRNRVESVEQNARMRFDQFPEAQRRALSAELRKRALDELILAELVYQEANDKGLIASDAEVREYIRQIPILQENGRFLNDRYRAFLMQMNMSAPDFERQVRKQIVTEKLQNLFVGSATPSREELRRNRMLANQKVNVRFAELGSAQMASLITDSEVQAFVSDKKAEIEKYYNDNKTEFSTPEQIKARHILIRVDEKRSDTDALKLAQDLHKQATPANFGSLATKYSDDPGSKTNGGDLGEFAKGRMVPAFEQAAFGLDPGKISDPVKTDFGYHIILVEKKSEAKVEPLEQVQTAIARKLLARQQGGEAAKTLKQAVSSGDQKAVQAQLARAGAKWQESGEFDLATPAIPKLGESEALLGAVIKSGSKKGMIPELIPHRDGFVVAEILSWKEAPEKEMNAEGLERMVAFRKSNDLIESWSKEVEADATIQRNPRLFQQ